MQIWCTQLHIHALDTSQHFLPTKFVASPIPNSVCVCVCVRVCVCTCVFLSFSHKNTHPPFSINDVFLCLGQSRASPDINFYLLLIYLFIYSFIYLFIYSFIYLFIYSFIYLFIYLFISRIEDMSKHFSGEISRVEWTLCQAQLSVYARVSLSHSSSSFS